MSKSRLEKFLYALYSLDSSDLPTPLSRIEELYKCWVTGEEAPSFEPISRVEKYLMAILGAYDVDSLPNPLSRVEVLLYKLATGDDNLDDVKSFLSEHEELLVEIIRNGGVGGNIDIEYVLYTLSTEFNTLYNTAEKPVKSAILKGKTINNLWTKSPEGVIVQENTADTTIEPYSEQYVKITFGETQVNAATTVGLGTTQRLQANKTYYINTFIIDGYEVTDTFLVRDNLNAINLETLKITGYPAGQILSFTTRAETDKLKFYYFAHTRKNGAINYGKPFYMPKRFIISDKLEDVVNQDFFEGMQSVKMPVLKTVGKNLFEKSKVYYDSSFNNNGIQTHNTNYVATDYIEVSSNKTYVSNRLDVVAFYDSNKKFISMINGPASPRKFTTPSNCKYIRVRNYSTLPSLEEKQNVIEALQIELGTEPTSYEPYKSNILTVNEDIELRGIGDVKDELDLTTGKLTQRTIQIPLNSDYFNFSRANNSDLTNTIRWQLTFKDVFIANSIKVGSNGKCNIMDYYKGGGADKECIFLHPSAVPNRLQIKQLRTDTRFTTSEELELFLLENQAYVVLELATESVKTVDLSVVDQDGNDTELSTFNDITYVTLSSEGLIPEAELVVATKNKEVLNTLSLEMDDISTSQNTLEETANTQSENVDATMIATTEIYEGLL